MKRLGLILALSCLACLAFSAGARAEEGLSVNNNQIAVMMLVDEGKVALDDPVAKHLPEFRGQMLVASKSGDTVTLKKPARPITLRDLLTHTSGLPSGPPDSWEMRCSQYCTKSTARMPSGTEIQIGQSVSGPECPSAATPPTRANSVLVAAMVAPLTTKNWMSRKNERHVIVHAGSAGQMRSSNTSRRISKALRPPEVAT